ncbi:hypothetical protein [Pseudoalteromonas rubra]|uniref:Uncharacterized protein n=1 Tax=Pseudoalteromonas rubra TaxID=43658 RepID=A0A0U3IAU5_9GAMM|nr:hypothetical protein [Pseudoalteromonas rubra]ALU45215.1 hypothetical protein AT705_19840 [Pseudoalteromonas rubra]
MKYLIALFMLIVSTGSYANYQSQGQVTNIMTSLGKVIVTVKNVNGAIDKFWFTPDSDINRVSLSLFLTAKATQGTVWVNGSDTIDNLQYPHKARRLIAMDYK